MMNAMTSANWSWRRSLVMAGFAALGMMLIGRAAYVQVVKADYYREQGANRHIRTVVIPAHRGDLLDRTGKPLAISTPVDTFWAVPETLADQSAFFPELERLLGLDELSLSRRVEHAVAIGRKFMYVKRHVMPEVVSDVQQLQVAGLGVRREYGRYYPSGATAAHVLGFTGIDDFGREGLEMAYNNWLTGSAGLRRIVQDRTGREITELEVIKPEQAGKDLVLSIDRQLQYFADKALRKAITTQEAESGSIVMLDIQSGEVLGMVNYPDYNPNNRRDRSGGRQRNRAVTDVFEPGSTMKPFTIAAALESGNFDLGDQINTSPGWYHVNGADIKDFKDYGVLDLNGIVTHSSNVGISKIAAKLDSEQMWSVFDKFGFGHRTGSEFPGEVAGYFNHSSLWHRSEQASLSFGYGISVTALQLARAYAALANKGVMPTISFVHDEDEAVEESDGLRIVSSTIATEIGSMLESVVNNGSGKRAKVPGYRIAGKTGTAHRSQSGGYAEDRYASLFAGYAPASNPSIAMVVVIHDPKAGEHFGGAVAAPVFAEVMSHALRLMGIEPDDVDQESAQAPGMYTTGSLEERS